MEMKKRDWLLVLSPLLFVWGVDRITKTWALSLVGVKFYGPVGFLLHFNPGAILGTFSDLPPILRVVSLSTGGAFLVFWFFILQWLLPTRSLLLRSGMSFLLGGILGNVTDRIMWGRVVDFVVISAGGYTSPAFNLADVLQWVGYIIIVYCLFKEGKSLWPEKNLRNSYFINTKFQVRYSLKLMSFSFFFAIISGVLSFTYLKVTITELVGMAPQVEQKFLTNFVVTYLIVSITFSVIMFFVGVMISHRTAGPLYAFERFLEDLLRGNTRALKLRAGDEFRHLEELAEKLARDLPSQLRLVDKDGEPPVPDVPPDQGGDFRKAK
ncbi:MAG TPA: signal peptidase II [Bdellovibrionales bacterium]|nr:signal peptidase II [Bdellovibrionales bacterium]